MKFKYITISLLFLIMSYASAAQMKLTSYSENDRKYVSAMGLVLDDITKAALSNAKVVLTNRNTEEQKEVITEIDGNFVFSLQPDTEYSIYATDGNFYSKQVHISQADFEKNKVLSLILVVPRAILPAIENMKNGTTPNFDIETINFKIELGRFAQPMPLTASYFDAIRDDLNEYQLENGKVIYALGAFEKYADALSFEAELKNKGYRDVKTVAYLADNPLERPADEVQAFGNQQRSMMQE